MKNASKKIVAGMMAVGMLAAVALPTFAEETKSLELQYAQDTTYTLSIPSLITLDAANPAELSVGLSAVNTAPDKKVQVKIVNVANDDVVVAGDTLTVSLTRANDDDTKVVSTVTRKDGAALGGSLVVAEYNGYSAPASEVITDDTLLSGSVLNFSKVIDSNTTEETVVAVKAGSYTGTMVFEGVVAAMPVTEDGGTGDVGGGFDDLFG